jgi:hypothetical protein
MVSVSFEVVEGTVFPLQIEDGGGGSYVRDKSALGKPRMARSRICGISSAYFI